MGIDILCLKILGFLRVDFISSLILTLHEIHIYRIYCSVKYSANDSKRTDFLLSRRRIFLP